MNSIDVLVILSMVLFCQGTAFELSQKISGGSNAPEGSAPHQISIKDSGGDHTCGGSILNEYWILTAAHCTDVCKRNGCEIEYGTTILGQGMTAKVVEVYDHPRYLDAEELNDISLLKVKEPLRLGGKAKAIKLNKKKLSVGQQGVITGWGDTTGTKVYPIHLQMAKMKVTKCLWNRGKLHYYVCVRSSDASACRGDSGGPLVVGNRLAGVTSFGPPHCKPNSIIAYTMVSKYISWIEKVTNIAY